MSQRARRCKPSGVSQTAEAGTMRISRAKESVGRERRGIIGAEPLGIDGMRQALPAGVPSP